jgi:hypothetical protein
MTTDLRALRRKDEERELAYKQQLAVDEERIRAEARKMAEAEYQLQLQDREKQLANALEEAELRERSFKDQLAAAENRIKGEARKNADDEYALKLREKDKQLADAWQKVKEAEAKMQQSSQQAQGEALELEIEELLRDAFRDDEISEVKKDQRGADTVQKVIDRKGRLCGAILWESKNAQWSGSVAELRSIILKARGLADDHAEQERAAAAVKAWLLARIEKKRRTPLADEVDTAPGEPCAPERLAA